MAKITVAMVLVLTGTATLYVYWTRTPQYTLLQVLHAYAQADLQRVALHIEEEQPLKKRLRVQPRTENVMQQFARIQNEALEVAYRVTVEEAHIGGTRADLHVRLNEMPYQLTFDVQQDGRWKLIDFKDRQTFSEQVVKGMKRPSIANHCPAMRGAL